MTRVYWLEARTEFLKLARMRSYSLSTILFPLMFYCFFGLAMAPHGGDDPDGALPDRDVRRVCHHGLDAVRFRRGNRCGARAWVAGGKAFEPDAAGGVLFCQGRGGDGVRGDCDPDAVHDGRGLRTCAHGAAQWMLTFGALVAGAIPFCALGLTIGTWPGRTPRPPQST